MQFLPEVSAAAVLVRLTVAFQSAGMAFFIHSARTQLALGMDKLGPLHSTLIIIRLTLMMIGLHVAQIILWAGFYRWGCFASCEPAFYFSTASYSTVGYGDVVLPRLWRN